MSFPRYAKYKTNDNEWLSEVPEHWRQQRRKDIASCNDAALNEKTPDDFEIEPVDISNVEAGRGITSSEKLAWG